jgi:tRNA A-37 threonylcarbamoyl transferase component Bud32
VTPEVAAHARAAATGPEAPGLERLARRPDRWVVGVVGGPILKVYLHRAGPLGLLDRLGLGRAERAARRARRAWAAGLPVPAMQGVLRLPGAAVLAMERAPGVPLAQAAAEAEAPQRLAEAVGALVARIHQAGVYPGDLHQGNVLVAPGGGLSLIDPDQLRPVSFVSRRRRVRNLERLWRDFPGLRPFTALRALVRYAGGAAAARPLARAVAARAEAKRRQYGLPPPP